MIPRLQDIPLRRKLLVVFLLTTGAAMVTMRATFVVREFILYRDAVRHQAEMIGGIVARNSTAVLAFENADEARDILAGLQANPHISGAALYNQHGELFATYPEGRSAADFPSAQVERSYRFGDGKLRGFEPVREGERYLGGLYLEIDTRVLLREWLMGSVALASLIMLGVLVIAFLVSRRLMRRISEPVLALAETARGVSEKHDYSLRAPVTGRDEIGELAADFNEMLARIQAQDRAIREAAATLEQRVAERTAQLQEANRELESFSYSVSHDLRAPLRHINGFVQLLEKEGRDKLSGNSLRYLDVIAKSARSMGLLIDELLAFSRMGRTEMRYSPTDMRILVDEVVQELKSDFPERKIEWRIGELPTVEADAAMMRQVWRNLLGNAVKYSAKRELALIEVGCRKDEREYVFHVRDNGAGFDMKYAEKLFGVFQRLHSVQEFEGNGIGLANVRRIVQRHGGRTWAEAEVERGATFYFTLPNSKTPKP